jgi:hypothetical protein
MDVYDSKGESCGRVTAQVASIAEDMVVNLCLRSLISMLLDWVSFLAYPNLFGIKGFVVVVVDLAQKS